MYRRGRWVVPPPRRPCSPAPLPPPPLLSAANVFVFGGNRVQIRRNSEVTYLPVTTLTSATERRKGRVSYPAGCRVNPDRRSRHDRPNRQVSYLPVTTLTSATERRKGRVSYLAGTHTSKKGEAQGGGSTKGFLEFFLFFRGRGGGWLHRGGGGGCVSKKCVCVCVCG